MSKVDEDLNDSFSRMNTSKLSDEYDPLVAVFSSSATASTASNDEDDDSDEWEKHSIEKRRNRTLTPTINMTFSPRLVKRDLFEGLRNLPFSRSNSPEDKKQQRSHNDLDKISSEDTQKSMESTEESAIVKEAVEQLEAALERFTLTSPIAMPQSKPRSIYDLKEKVNDDDTRMSSLPVEMPLSTKLSLEANMNEIKTWAMLVKRETLKIKQINQEEITTTTTANMLTKSDDATSDADKELIGKLQAEIEAYKDREKKYVNQITNIVDQNEQFQLIADEFEKIFKQFVVEKDANEAKLHKEIVDLTKERDHLQEDVVGIEQSFDNLHKRFENLKSKVNVFKTNEDNLQKVIESYKQQLEREKMKYSTLKKHAEEKLDVANVEIEKLRKNTGIEIQTLKAELKRSEIKINSMELNIQQKDQENSQLTNLLEDLLNKVKPNNATY